MNLPRFTPSGARLLKGAAALLSIAILAACQGTSKPKPAELPANAPVMGVRQAWSVQIPSTANLALVANVSGDVVTVAGGDGTVVAIDARNGTEMWRAKAGAPLVAGVGSDGTLAAVVTNENNLVALQGGKVLWKQKLSAETYTPPLVAGRRIFVQTADRTTTAWDGQSGRRLWTQTRTADTLVLKRPGVMLAVGDTLIAGVGGRLVGMNPANGASRWESPIAAPRGTNDVERLVDLTGSVSRAGNSICARAYFATIGCVDTSRGALLWTKPAQGSDGLGGDDNALYGVESNGVVNAWRRADGERLWSVDQYKYRQLTAPLAVGRTLILGEGSGQVLFLNREDGSALNRVAPDGSAIAADPVLAANTVVVVTRKGGVFGYRPE
ncbi:MAG TPA: outer membrane protein assembly factor BamB [Variovorax sp.]|nr:outer membrane protein assembly factor BamB [Variovorax sp.]